MIRKAFEGTLSPRGLVPLLAWTAIVLATIAMTLGIYALRASNDPPSSTRGRDRPAGSGLEPLGRCGSRPATEGRLHRTSRRREPVGCMIHEGGVP
jgi:hypothetical protein